MIMTTTTNMKISHSRFNIRYYCDDSNKVFPYGSKEYEDYKERRKFKMENELKKSCQHLSTRNLTSKLEDLFHDEVYCKLDLNISDEEIETMHNQVFHGQYVLSPLRVHFIKSSQLHDELCKLYPKCPEYISYPSHVPDLYIVVRPDYKDVLIIMALSKILHDIFYEHDGNFCPFDTHQDYYHSTIQEMGMVDSLFRIDIIQPMAVDLVLEKLERYAKK